MKHKQSLCVISLCLILIGGAFVEVGAFDTRDLEKLNATGMCKSCNLIRANLAGVNLSDSNLNKASLIGADLSKANLKGAILNWAALRMLSLRGSDLTDGKLIKVNLRKADLTGAILTGANLEGTLFCNTTMPDGIENNSSC